jgi:AmiR/NasT family two-component response regulator
MASDARRLSTLIVNERADRLMQIGPVLAALGHEVIARDLAVDDVAALTAAACPDLALVGLGRGPAETLDVIEAIVGEAVCPAVLLMHERDPAFVLEASKRGVFAYVSSDDVEDWQGAIHIVVSRFAEYQDLRGAFDRRTVIERAKGILMERHRVDAEAAFEMLRVASRTDNRKLVDLATAVADGHRLLSAGRFARDAPPGDDG